MLYRNVVFSNAPLLKGFCYKNIFQLVPVSLNGKAPMSRYATHIPLFLEYEAEDKKEDSAILSYLKEKGMNEDLLEKGRSVPSQERVRREILTLLTCLTNFRFFSYYYSGCWAVQTPSINNSDLKDKELLQEEKEVSSWCIPIYTYPELRNDLQISAFTPCTEYYSCAEEARTYFTVNPTIENNLEVKFPADMEFCMDRYFSLEEELRIRTKHCMGLLADGIALFDTKRSVSLLAIISSIEGMAKIDNNMYGENKSLGTKKRFLRYLKRYVAGRSEDKYKTYYNKRCSITHEGDLFLGDIDIFADPQQQKEDWCLRLEIQQVARLALYNWLRRKM